MARHKAITFSVKADVCIPRVPNFFILTDGSKVPISAISDQGLREVGAAWTEDLVARAKEQAKERK